MRKWWLCAGLSFLASPLWAGSGLQSDSSPRSPVRAVMGIGYTQGGDKASTVYFNDGSSENIRFGSGLDWRLGAEWQLTSPLSVQGTFGYRDDHARVGHGARGQQDFVGYRRANWEILGQFLLSPQWQVSAGIGRAFDAVYREQYGGQRSTFDFSGELAKVLQLECLPAPQYGLAARYVWEHTQPSAGGRRQNASHVGLYLLLHLP